MQSGATSADVDRTRTTSSGSEARDRQRQAGTERAWQLPARSLITEQSLRTDRANSKEQVRQLNQEVKLLRQRLEITLGAEDDDPSGGHAHGAIKQQAQRILDLEADNTNLRQS
jgi:hypothetical protein